MNRRIIAIFCLTTLLLTLSSCPPAAFPDVMLGVWYFVSANNGAIIGFEILPNGEVDEFDNTSVPPGANALFGGEVTWEQNGDQINFQQVTTGGTTNNRGTLLNSTYAMGTSETVGSSGPQPAWVASKMPNPF